MTNNERIQANNQELQVCIDKANALPEAGGGAELPTLDAPAAAEEVFLGKDYIDAAGSKKTGTFTVEEEVDNLKALTAELLTALDGKASSGVETCTVVILDDTACDHIVLTYTALENGKIVTKQVEDPFVWNDEYDNEAAILENIVVGTSITFQGTEECSFSGENFELWFAAEEWASSLGFVIHNLKILGDATITADSLLRRV